MTREADVIGNVWSCGGGTQSAAIAALIVKGKLPKPHVSVIADTGREASETWEYYESVLQPELAKVGVDLVRLPHSYSGNGYNTVDLYSGKDGKTVVMPMYTTHSGESGALSKYCSNEWKSRPVDRYVREQGLTGGRIWIGYSREELTRMRASDPKSKWDHWYPLIERRMTRADSIRLVEEMGWPTPPRSACWMCPYHTDREWLYLKKNQQQDFQKAVALEKYLQINDPSIFFHNSCEPLDAISFNEEQQDMFDMPCASGMCFT